MGAVVVELDMSLPFTAARAATKALARLEKINPAIRFVQFVDGDCEDRRRLAGDGQRVLEERHDVAVVAGRRRERPPRADDLQSLGRPRVGLADRRSQILRWRRMVRGDAFRQVGGYNPTLIAGEEPDLCVRLRQHGWIILRIDAEMTLHDIAMTRFSQWWKRSERGGFAFAQGVAMHGRPPERHWVHELRSTILWGLIVPLFILGLAWPTHGASLVLALAYPLQAWRITRRHRKQGMSTRDARIWGWNCVLCRFPNAFGRAALLVQPALGSAPNLDRIQR